MLNRSTETKYIGQWITADAVQTGVAPFSAPQFENVVQQLGARSGGNWWSAALPAIVQAGTGSTKVSDQTRIGDRIEPSAHHVKMTLRFTQKAIPESDPGAQDIPLDITAYIFYGYIKSMKTYSGAVTYQGSSMVVTGQSEAGQAMNNVLDDGDGTFSTFNGDPRLAQQPLSKYVKMKVKKVHLRRAAGWINTNANNGGAVPNSDSQNTLSKTFSLKFKPPGKLQYTNAADIYPQNYAPVFAVGYVYNDATASGNNAAPAFPYGQLEYVAQSQMWFKDHQ